MERQSGNTVYHFELIKKSFFPLLSSIRILFYLVHMMGRSIVYKDLHDGSHGDIWRLTGLDHHPVLQKKLVLSTSDLSLDSFESNEAWLLFI